MLIISIPIKEEPSKKKVQNNRNYFRIGASVVLETFINKVSKATGFVTATGNAIRGLAPTTIREPVI